MRIPGFWKTGGGSKKSARRRRTRFVAGIRILAHVLWQSDILTRAAALSYALVFSLVPLLATSLAFFTALPALRNQRQQMLDFLFAHLLPGAVEQVRSYLVSFSNRAAATGIVGSIVFIIFVLLLFQGIESAFNALWRVERGRTWGTRIKALALFLIAGALGVAAIIELTNLAKHVAPGGAPVRGNMWWSHIAGIVAASAVFTVANRVVPLTRVEWRSALIGGAVAGTIWHFVKFAFTWYVQNLGSYESIYGALGTIPAFFLWVWLSILLLLGGAYIAFVHQNLRALMVDVDRRDDPCPDHAVAIMAVLARAFRSGEQPIAANPLADRIGLPVYFVRSALNRLVAGGLVLSLPHGREQLYSLARPSETISLDDIVTRVAGRGSCPEACDHDSQLWHHVESLFHAASAPEGNVLARARLSDLEGDAA